jgi:hypothetical protein
MPDLRADLSKDWYCGRQIGFMMVICCSVIPDRPDRVGTDKRMRRREAGLTAH